LILTSSTLTSLFLFTGLLNNYPLVGDHGDARQQLSESRHEAPGPDVHDLSEQAEDDDAVRRLLQKARTIQTSFSRPFKLGAHAYFKRNLTATPYAFPTVLDSPVRCGNESSPFVVVLVLSSYRANGMAERQAVRNTYGSVARGGRWPGGTPLLAPVRLVFLLGAPPSLTHQRQARAESELWGDVLVTDFVDSYTNLTLKVLSGLNWALAACPSAKYFLKADDDVFVNLPLLLAFLTHQHRNKPHKEKEEKAVYGTGYPGGRVMRQGRWRVARTAYPLTEYPPYMSGTAYVLSAPAARGVVAAAASFPFIPLEDAFVTGVLAQVTMTSRYRTHGFTDIYEHPAPWRQFTCGRRLVVCVRVCVVRVYLNYVYI
jgi:hypothetical protein